MHLFRFKALFVFMIFINLAWGNFNDNECLKSQYQAMVSHKGAPLGLFENVLKIDKKDCVIVFEHKKMKFIRKKWEVDVCRTPVHIKYGTGAVEVLKKEFSCMENASGAFCKNILELQQIIQDDGLIFAPGEKEDLSSDHGKFYCAYLLLGGYFHRDIIFSKYEDYQDILQVPVFKRAAPSVTPTSTAAPIPTATPLEDEKSEEVKTGEF